MFTFVIVRHTTSGVENACRFLVPERLTFEQGVQNGLVNFILRVRRLIQLENCELKDKR